MKNVWKWVIGIVIVLVVVAALVVGVFLLRSHFGNLAYVGGFNHGMRPYRNDGWRGMPMGGPGMMGFGRGFPFLGFFGSLFCLGVLALLVLGIIWLVRSLRKPVQVSAAVAQPVTPIAEPVAPAAEPVAAAVPVAEVHPCPNCGQPVQESWNHCPNCGEKLK